MVEGKREGFWIGRVVEEQTLKHCFNEIVEPLNYVKTTVCLSFHWPPDLRLNNPTEHYISLAQSQYRLRIISSLMFARSTRRRLGGQI